MLCQLELRSRNQAALGIIADVHLHPEEERKSDRFIRFLQTTGTRFDALFILGDLFDFWIGDDSIGLFEKEVAALKEYACNHDVYIQHGNRDFLIGRGFEEYVGAFLITDPFLLQYDDRKYLLTHGDSLCSDDRDYQKLRSTVRSSEWQQEMLSKSLAERLEIAAQMRRESIAEDKKKDSALRWPVAAEVKRLFRLYTLDLLIHGHTHQQGEYTYNSCPVLTLGAWSEQGWSMIETHPDARPRLVHYR